MKLKNHAFAIKKRRDNETDKKDNTCNLSESNEHDCKSSPSSPKL